MGLLPSQILAHLLIGITIAMRLVVGLIHHIDAPTVAKFIEIFTVRIVRCAQEVNIGLLHQPDILLVGSFVHIAARLRMVVMAIYTTLLHILAVDFEHLANDLDLLHAQMVVEMLYLIASFVVQLYAERIQILQRDSSLVLPLHYRRPSSDEYERTDG